MRPNYFIRGFEWSVGRRVAYRLPLPVALILVGLLLLLSHS